MTKIRALLIVFALLFISNGCVNNSQPSDENNNKKDVKSNIEKDEIQYFNTTNRTSTDTPVGLSSKDFIIKSINSNDTFIEVGGNYTTNDELVNVRYLDERHVYDTYHYQSFTITVSPAHNTVMSISLLSSELETSRGVKIGDSIEYVYEKYGEPQSKSAQYYLYQFKYNQIAFCFDINGRVNEIELFMI